MGKINFSKLGLSRNMDFKSFTWNDQIIEIKQYLPTTEKFELISSVLSKCQDENNFVNEAKLQVCFNFEVIQKYTNITFSDKQKSDIFKTYDLLISSGFFKELQTYLPEEINTVYAWLTSIAAHFYEYRNSVYAILDSLNTDYNNLSMDINGLMNKIQDPESLSLLKNIVQKLG